MSLQNNRYDRIRAFMLGPDENYMSIRSPAMIAGLAVFAVACAVLFYFGLLANIHKQTAPLAAGGTVEFKPPPGTPDLSSRIEDMAAKATAQAQALAMNSEPAPIKWPPPPAPTGLQSSPLLSVTSVAQAPAMPGQGQQGEGPSAADMAAQTQAAMKRAQEDSKALAEAAKASKPQDDPMIERLARYGTPVTAQLLPVGGLTRWTVISKSGKPVQLYTTADGKALVSGVVWNLETGQNVSDSITLPTTGNDPNFERQLPKVVNSGMPSSNLVSGRYALPAAFDGATPTQIPEAIKLVDELAGYKEGKGGPADTLYIIVDPRCPYCRRAYLSTREYVKNGATIKWIPTVALGHPEQGLPLAATILRANNPSNPDIVARVLGNHETIATLPTDFELKQLDKSLNFMFEAFRQNNEPNPGVPVAFFIDRRSGKARMMMGVSEQPVLDDILGNPNTKK